MRILLSILPIAAPAVVWDISPRMQNLIVSILLAVVVYFTGGSPPKRGKHRDDYDSN